MLLCDQDIRQAIHDRAVTLDPYEPEFVQPASVDIRLDRIFRVFNRGSDTTHIDPAQRQEGLTTLVRAGADGFVLHPNAFVLASTVERVTLDATVAARLEGKSSLGRLGLVVHVTAGFIDPGWDGHITLELSNLSPLPIRLHVGMKVGQLCFFRLSSPAVVPYNAARNRYQGQQGPAESQAWRDFPPR